MLIKLCFTRFRNYVQYLLDWLLTRHFGRFWNVLEQRHYTRSLFDSISSAHITHSTLSGGSSYLGPFNRGLRGPHSGAFAYTPTNTPVNKTIEGANKP